MAQRVVTHLIDDLDGSPATQTLSFAFAGKPYEIDLNDTNVAAFEEAVAPFITAARRTGASSARSGSRRSRSAGPGSAADVREWAKGKGLTVTERGRIPAAVREAYDAAH